MRSVSMLLLALVAGCSTRATVHRHSAGLYREEIIGGTRSDLILEAADGRRIIVPRSDVTDVDHPGKTQALIGGAWAAAAIAGLLAAHYGAPCPPRQTECMMTLGTVGFVGAITGAWGVMAWTTSRRNAASTDGPPSR